MDRPAWVLGVQNISRVVASVTLPGTITWTRAPTYEHRDGPPTRYYSDPYTYLEFARQMPSFAAPHYREPLVPFSVKVWLKILDDKDVAVSFASVTFSVLAVWATYLLGAAAFSTWLGLAAALGLAIEYDVVSEAIGGGRDSAFTFAVVMVAYAMVRYLRKPSTRGAIFVGACAGTSCLVRVTSASFLAPGFTYLLLASPLPWKMRCRHAAATALVAAALVGPYMFNCWRAFGDPLYAINYHTANQLQMERQQVEPASTVGNYLGTKFRSRPAQTLDTMALGLTTFPFLNKWAGFDRWLPGLGRAWSFAALVGLVLFVGGPVGRLLLVVLITSLVPYAFTWKLAADWRFTVHAYPFFLIASAVAPARLVTGFRSSRRWAAARPIQIEWRPVGFWTGVVAAIALTVWVLLRVLPVLTVREAVATHDEGMIQAGDRDAAFFREGWSASTPTGALVMRESRGGTSTIVLPLPSVNDYALTVRLDPIGAGATAASTLPALHVSLNGQPIGDLQPQITPGRVGSYDIHLARQLVRRGSNSLAFTGAAFAVWYVRIHPWTDSMASRPAIEVTPKPRLGYLDSADCSAIKGWAAGLAELDAPVAVDVFDAATPLATVIGDAFRPDLLAAQLGNGRHAFSFSVPAALLDGKTHDIRVRLAGTPRDLIGSPAKLTCKTP